MEGEEEAPDFDVLGLLRLLFAVEAWDVEDWVPLSVLED